MKICFFSRIFSLFFFIIAISLNSSLYADSNDFDCNDLYGDCNNNSHNDTSNKRNTPTIKSPSTPASTTKPTTSSGKNTLDATTKPDFPQKPNEKNAFMASGAMPEFTSRKRNFLYSVVFLTALFDNGVQKQGYGILLQDGYTLASSDLMTEKDAYLKSVIAKMQDDSSNSLMCFAMLRLRADDTKLSLLRAENYTDLYCNTRPESFYHQRINLYYFTPVQKGMLKRTILSRSDSVRFPFITENNTLHYKTSSIANIQKHNAIHGLPLFNANGSFVGFLYTTNNPKQRNVVISSDEVHNFICTIAKRRLLPVSDITRACGVNK